MNKTQIYMIVKSQFMEKKTLAESIAFNNLQKALTNPDFNALYKRERELVFDIAKLKSVKKPIENLQEELMNVRNRKTQLMQIMKFQPSDLSPQYECQICKDSGLISSTKTCKCFDKKLKEEIVKRSSNNLQNLHNFNEFNEKIAKDEKHQTVLHKLKDYMKSWVEDNTQEKPKLICLSGKTGVGKTFLTECTATYALKKGKLVSLISAFSMNNIFLKYHTSKTEDKVTVLDSLMDPDLLIIDDLGTEPILNNVTVEYLYLLISERLMQNKSTLITTNLDGEGILTRYGERIFSRIFNKRQCKIFQIKGADLRINN